MDQTQHDQTGNEPAGDAAPQNTNPVQPQAPAQVPSASAPTAAVPAETDEVRGLKQAAESERRKRQDLEAQLVHSQTVISQLASQVHEPQAPAPPQDPLGLSDEDLLDPAKVRQALLKMDQRNQAAIHQAVAEVQFRMQYPDYEQLVGSVDPMTGHLPPQHQRFLPSEIMQEAIREDPTLMARIGQSGNPRLFAYEVAKRHKEIRELRAKIAAGAQQTQQETVAAQHIANTVAALTAPMSPSAVSGPPASDPNTDALALLRSNPAAFDALVQSIQRGKYG